jgi:adenosylcobinamide-GDP ribazoletransferase
VALPPLIGGARAALGFLTRIPIGGVPREADLRWAPGYFPLVGAGVGALSALVYTATASAGSVVAATLAIGAGMLITGAFHEDGLADSADALGGAYTRERLFEILKDSRVGTFGAAALVVSIGLRIALLPPVWLIGSLPYVTANDTRRSPAFDGSLGPIMLASATVAIAATYFEVNGWIAPSELLAIGASAIAITLLCGWRFHARAGGLTGDFLGATEQICECGMLLVLAL